MANGKTYGLSFPFVDSFDGKYLDLTDFAAEEIRSNLIHLLLTRKGSRYYLPDFGTRLYEYIFEPLDGPTFRNIESEIRDSVERYMPQLQLTNISITAPDTGTATTAVPLATPVPSAVAFSLDAAYERVNAPKGTLTPVVLDLI